MENLISETYNKIFNIKRTYKCLTYIDDKKGDDKMVDAFEIQEVSIRKAYNTAYEVLKLKYPGMGFDVRIYPFQK